MAVVLLNKGGDRCAAVTSVALYPTAVAAGASLQADLPKPIAACGTAYVLPTLAPTFGASRAKALGQLLVRLAPHLTSMGSATPASAAIPAPVDSSGYAYGTDSNTPTALGTGPYYEPHGSSCGTTSCAGYYGFYSGEIASMFRKNGCTSAPNYYLNINSTNQYDANRNATYYGKGFGAYPYFMAMGPGADPHYDGTTSEASSFGTAEAKYAASFLGNGTNWIGLHVYFDIEDAYNSGWNAVWTGSCGGYGGSLRYSSIPSAVDLATYTAFRNYLINYTGYYAGVYCAGGSSRNSWSGIFGSAALPTNIVADDSEWTYVNETSSTSAFPFGFSVSGVSAVWFAGISSASMNASKWQWSGGNGTSNGYGDFDQLKINSYG